MIEGFRSKSRPGPVLRAGAAKDSPLRYRRTRQTVEGSRRLRGKHDTSGRHCRNQTRLTICELSPPPWPHPLMVPCAMHKSVKKIYINQRLLRRCLCVFARARVHACVPPCIVIATDGLTSYLRIETRGSLSLM
ncbi:hypothetical protein EVAR_49454_1 [Eumeta japonica]|uniref:Uncharacterized protein n=1 Tax=Eumeta variegata TaxID=151549 RepID=A0A4C1Y4F9_EUMVA|nr:hypothetical protein EVAR_49454_1 [Eumeta japonica]